MVGEAEAESQGDDPERRLAGLPAQQEPDPQDPEEAGERVDLGRGVHP